LLIEATNSKILCQSNANAELLIIVLKSKAMKNFMLTWMIIFGSFMCVQSQNDVSSLAISKPDSLRQAGNLTSCIVEYRNWHQIHPKDQQNVYNFASALAVARQNDSCFKYLNLAIELDTNLRALTDPDFIAVKSDDRWRLFEDRLISMLSAKNGRTFSDIDYAKQLWRMRAKDQAHYKDIALAESKFERRSTIEMALWNLKELYNEENVQQLERLIDEKGWPKFSEVGETAAGAAFLVIQHNDIVRQKKYLPEIERLCNAGEASWKNYALMYDRILVSDNKPQKYGSQIDYNEATGKYELFPLMDESKVDQWRKEVGLQPLAKYVAQWDIQFEPKSK
jgi:hypothetical protein